ncbi:hypothetical protein [Herbaspirillum huttiense]|uniref:hypothetical protein n=1 Tax=Herbaspirillum huttiense TaxID=863372 RepID=UPI002E772B16|nr:hypothetical protein [Herbaspirillum huttiense]MEE1638611.1 hypothetical protein [Herbaspirillum huttiense NC40101]
MSTATCDYPCGSVVVCCHRGTQFRDFRRREKPDKAEYIIPDMRTISFFEAVLAILRRNCTRDFDKNLHFFFSDIGLKLLI